MAKRKTRKEKKRLMFISIVMIALIAVLVFSVYKDFVQILQDKKDIKEYKEEYDNLLAEEEELSLKYEKMQDPDYIARYAKEKYMYSSSGEYIIRID